MVSLSANGVGAQGRSAGGRSVSCGAGYSYVRGERGFVAGRPVFYSPENFPAGAQQRVQACVSVWLLVFK